MSRFTTLNQWHRKAKKRKQREEDFKMKKEKKKGRREGEEKEEKKKRKKKKNRGREENEGEEEKKRKKKKEKGKKKKKWRKKKKTKKKRKKKEKRWRGETQTLYLFKLCQFIFSTTSSRFVTRIMERWHCNSSILTNNTSYTSTDTLLCRPRFVRDNCWLQFQSSFHTKLMYCHIPPLTATSRNISYYGLFFFALGNWLIPYINLCTTNADVSLSLPKQYIHVILL